MKKGRKLFGVVLVFLMGMGNLTACGSEGSTETIGSFEEANTDVVSLIALGNSDVPVGQYAQVVFENLGIWDDLQSKISFGSTVKEVLAQVEQGSVDCGVVYATDAATSELVQVICTAPEEALDTPVVYPVAILDDSKNKEAAEVFLSYLYTEAAFEEFKKVGFSTLGESSSQIDYEGEPCSINLYAAASLTESISAIKELFEEAYPEIEVIVNFDSSGTLKTQIEEGAEADLFFSASSKQMNALEEGGFILTESRVDLLENKIVLIVPMP